MAPVIRMVAAPGWRRLAPLVVLLAACSPAAVEPVAVTPTASRAAAGEVALHVRFAPAAGTTIAWAELGGGDPLLLLNGTGSPMSEWDPALLGALAGRARVIVLDYPGLGQSGRPPSKITMQSQADWIAGFLDSIGVPRADILGWSMGSFIAQRLAVTHPEKVRSLVLAGANPGGPRAVLGPPWVQAEDSDPDPGPRAYLATNYPQTRCAQAAGRAFLRRQAQAVDSGRYPESVVPAAVYDAMVAAEDPWLRSSENSRALRGVRLPVLVIDGRRDVVTPAVNSRRIAARIPGARLLLYTGSGHSFLFQDPELVAGDVGRFISGELPDGPVRVPTKCAG